MGPGTWDGGVFQETSQRGEGAPLAVDGVRSPWDGLSGTILHQ